MYYLCDCACWGGGGAGVGELGRGVVVHMVDVFLYASNLHELNLHCSLFAPSCP